MAKLLAKQLAILGLSMMLYPEIAVAEPIKTPMERAIEQIRAKRTQSTSLDGTESGTGRDTRLTQNRLGIEPNNTRTPKQRDVANTASPSTRMYPKQSGANLGQCVARLNRTGGGWCEIRIPGKRPSISSVWPAKLDDRTRMIVGPTSVLIAWNGAAIDHQNNLMYFLGGGHADYGGNEVYEFDLKIGRWSRLTDPSPLNYLFQFVDPTTTKGARLCWSPDMRITPGSAHTYDGVQFSKRTRTIFLAMRAAANGSCFWDDNGTYENDLRILYGRDRGNGIFEFNPSRKEKRNNLAPLTWRRLQTKTRIGFPRSLEFPTGRMMLGSRTTMYKFDPVLGPVGKRLWREADWGDGLAEYHPLGIIMLLHAKILLLRNLSDGSMRKIPADVPHGRSLAVRKDGKVFSWDGKNKILTLDPAQPRPRWTLYDWSESGPKLGDGRVYSKWQYIRKDDVFVGLSHPGTGVWIYKHPANLRGRILSSIGQ